MLLGPTCCCVKGCFTLAMPAFQSLSTVAQSIRGWSSSPSAHPSTASHTGPLGGSSGAGWMKAFCSAKEASREGASTATAAATAAAAGVDGGGDCVDRSLLLLLLLLLPVLIRGLPLVLLLCLLLVFFFLLLSAGLPASCAAPAARQHSECHVDHT